MGRKIIDLTGKKFGNLVVLSIGYGRYPTTWICECDCGNVKEIIGDNMKNGSTISCGCKKGQHPSYAIDESGNVHGKLTVLYRDENKIKKSSIGKILRSKSMWVCKCECGNIVSVWGASLRDGHTQSCGKCLPSGVAAFGAMYGSMKQHAGLRGIPWNISREQVKEITSQNCHYCGKEPRQISKSSKNNGIYIHNGIDRMDSSIGYEIDNCVPCCKTCNFAKHVMSVDEFKKWIVSVYNHFIT